MKFNEFIPIWIEKKKPYVKGSTLASYKLTIKKHLLREFGELDINEIDNEIVTRYALNLLDKGLSIKSVQDIIIILKSILKQATIDEICQAKIIEVKYPKSYKENFVKKGIETFNDNDYTKLINYCKEHLTNKNLGILIVAYSGMRIGEICALKWKDIDVDNEFIKIDKTLQRIYVDDEDNDEDNTKIVIQSAKTENSNRNIPIIFDLMKVLKPSVKIYNPDFYVLSNEENPIEPRVYREYYKRLLNKLKIKYLKFHGLRHSFATRCINKGIDVKTVSDILGHSKVEITMNLYVHPNNDDKKKAIQKAFKGI